MQQSADFITAYFLYMFRASSAHHQEYKILTRQPPVQVVMVAGGSSLCHMAEWGSTRNHNYLYRWLLCQDFILLMMGTWHPKHIEKVCSNKICTLLHQVGVLFNLIVCFVFIIIVFDWHILSFVFYKYFGMEKVECKTKTRKELYVTLDRICST